MHVCVLVCEYLCEWMCMWLYVYVNDFCVGLYGCLGLCGILRVNMGVCVAVNAHGCVCPSERK